MPQASAQKEANFPTKSNWPHSEVILQHCQLFCGISVPTSKFHHLHCYNSLCPDCLVDIPHAATADFLHELYVFSINVQFVITCSKLVAGQKCEDFISIVFSWCHCLVSRSKNPSIVGVKSLNIFTSIVCLCSKEEKDLLIANTNAQNRRS